MEVAHILAAWGLPTCVIRKALLHCQHPLLAALGGTFPPGRPPGRWCSICGEHSPQLLFHCMRTLQPLCETCLLGERCLYCYRYR
jgi:hypothetical protein